MNSNQQITQAQAARFLQQAQFSSTLSEIKKVQAMGYESWIDEQISLPIAESGYDWIMNQKHTDEVLKKRPYPLFNMMWNQLFSAKDTLRKRVALAMSEIFVVSLVGIGIRYHSLGLANYWDILNKNAFGNYRELLEQITLSTAMGAYLNTLGNKKANPKKGSEPDENYAREVMQLFSIGLEELNTDGTKKINNGQVIETYDQQQIIELSKVFTGYLLAGRVGKGKITPERHRLPMENNPKQYDTSQKQVFDTIIPAGTDANTALKLALDAISNHANVAPFISKQLIQRLVTSNPSPAYVKRVATVFNGDAIGQRGNFAAVIKAILLDDEARNLNNDAVSGKVREPMISLIQWVSTFSSAQSQSGKWHISSMSNEATRLGQTPFMSPSVFNFYRPTYAASSIEDYGKVSPELYLVNETSVAGYINFMNKITRRGLSADGNKGIEIAPDYSHLLSMVEQPQQLVDYLNLVLCANSMTATTQMEIIQTLDLIPMDNKNWQKRRVALAIWMTMISPDYRVQK